MKVVYSEGHNPLPQPIIILESKISRCGGRLLASVKQIFN